MSQFGTKPRDQIFIQRDFSTCNPWYMSPGQCMRFTCDCVCVCVCVCVCCISDFKNPDLKLIIMKSTRVGVMFRYICYLIT